MQDRGIFELRRVDPQVAAADRLEIPVDDCAGRVEDRGRETRDIAIYQGPGKFVRQHVDVCVEILDGVRGTKDDNAWFAH